MKILVLSPKPPWPPHDGGAVAIMRCIEGLAACGASVTVLTMRTEKHGPGDTATVTIPSYIDRYECVPVDTRIKPIKALANLFFSHDPYDLRRFRSTEYSDALQSILRTGDYDLIHCEGLLFSYFVDAIRSRTGAPVVLRAHNLEHRIREMMADNERNILRKIYLKKLASRIKSLENEASKKFDAIVPISEPDYHWFRAVSAIKPVILCETGINVPEPVPVNSGDDLKVGFIGALNWQPNLAGLKWFLTEVWPSVFVARPYVTLHIAGSGAPLMAVKHLKGKNVMFEGEVADAAEFTSAMTVMIAPLFAGSGLRIKIIEAMSLGKPVVATPVAAEGLPAEDRREMFICNDAGKFSDTLISLLDNQLMREATGKAARELVKTRFDNRKLTAALFEFYHELSDDR
jgi:glycosyltransferase involved in cell wall biosynthesis